MCCLFYIFRSVSPAFLATYYCQFNYFINWFNDDYSVTHVLSVSVRCIHHDLINYGKYRADIL
jgi:hypothetical protein